MTIRSRQEKSSAGAHRLDAIVVDAVHDGEGGWKQLDRIASEIAGSIRFVARYLGSRREQCTASWALSLAN
jgi:hypothetical protein